MPAKNCRTVLALRVGNLILCEVERTARLWTQTPLSLAKFGAHDAGFNLDRLIDERIICLGMHPKWLLGKSLRDIVRPC